MTFNQLDKKDKYKIVWHLFITIIKVDFMFIFGCVLLFISSIIFKNDFTSYYIVTTIVSISFSFFFIFKLILDIKEFNKNLSKYHFGYIINENDDGKLEPIVDSITWTTGRGKYGVTYYADNHKRQGHTSYRNSRSPLVTHNLGVTLPSNIDWLKTYGEWRIRDNTINEII